MFHVEHFSRRQPDRGGSGWTVREPAGPGPFLVTRGLAHGGSPGRFAPLREKKKPCPQAAACGSGPPHKYGRPGSGLKPTARLPKHLLPPQRKKSAFHPFPNTKNRKKITPFPAKIEICRPQAPSKPGKNAKIMLLPFLLAASCAIILALTQSVNRHNGKGKVQAQWQKSWQWQTKRAV